MKQYTKEQLLEEIRKLQVKNAKLQKSDKKRKLAEDSLLQRENYLSALNKSKKILLTSERENVFQQFVDILGKASNANRTYIFINHTGEEDEPLMSQKAEYCSPGIKPEINNPDLQDLKYDDFFERWNSTLSKGEIIFGKIKDFPIGEKEFLELQDIKAVLIIPVMTDNKFIGFIGFDNCVSEREWDKAEQDFLHLAANDLAQYIERNRAQEQLKAENIRFQTTMDALDAVVYVADMHTYELLYLNELGKKTTGNNIGRKCYTALQRGYSEPCDFCTNHLLIDEKGNPKETYVWEFQNTITNRWYQLRDKAIYWPDGRIVRLEIATDITEQKKAEEAKKQSEEKYRKIFEHAPIGIVTIDKEGNPLTMNQALLDILGSPSVEATKQINVLKFTSLIKIGFSHDFKKCISTGKVIANENYYTSKWNKKSYIKYILTPILDKDNSITGVQTLFEDISQRKEAEDALRKSEDNLRTIFDNMEDVYYKLDASGNILAVSPSAAKMYNYSSVDEIIGKHVSDFVYNHEENELLVKELQTKGFVKNYPIVHKRKDGSQLYVEANITALYDKNGNIAETVGVLRDITERRESEKMIRKLSTAVEQSANTIVITDIEGNIEYINPKFTDLTGYKAEEVLGQNPRILNSGNQPKEYYTEMWQTISAGKTWKGEFNNKTKNGNLYWENVTISPIKNEEGKISNYLAIKEDITTQKQIEKALYESKIKFQETVDMLPLMVYESDLQGNLTFINKQVFESLGYSQEDFKDGINGFSSFIPEDRKRAEENVIKRIKGEEVHNNEYTIIRKDGSLVPVLIYTSPIFKDNKVVGTRGVIVDITESKKAEIILKSALEKAKESDMLKTAFLQNISHEIRTPMNGIVGFINLLKTPGLTGEEKLEYLDIIVTSSDRMLNTLSDLLDISKLETGQVELVTTTLNINKNLDDLCEDVQPEIESRGLQLNCNTALPEKEAIIITDQYKLNAILTNLLNNALKYTHKGSIDIGYTKKNDKLEFYVKDTGIGIPKDRLKAIFDRFVQADVEKIKVHEGSGLGLSISKSYVEMLGGSIWVESELDIGSQFYFTIPYPTVKPSNSKSGKPMRKLKILIAENEESADKYFTVALNHISSSILHAINGLEAVEVCRNNPDLDLILMDIRMPKLNGYAASQKIREFNEDVIIIAQTADTLGGDYDKSIAAGCDDYITKPINKKELIKKIEKLISG